MGMSIIASHMPLSAVLASEDRVVFAYPAAKIWNPRGVSLHRRIEAEELQPTLIDKLVSAENLERYIVPATIQAPTRCIDGRLTKNWAISSGQPRLGPKVAGGTAHAALAHRIVNVEDITEDLRFEADIRQVIKTYKRIGIGFGGHIDDHQSGLNTGCGAVDNINLILERLQLPEPQEQLRGLTRLILGAAYDESIANEVIGRMLYLDAVKPRYMPKEHDDPNGEFLYKRSIIKTIREQATAAEEPVPALTGSHHEVGVVLNFVAGTTLDTDRFSYDNQNLLQLFGWDIWEMYEEAKRLYRYSLNDDVQRQRQAVENRLKYIMVRTLLGLATTMVLTDGSLKLITVRSS